MEKLDPAGGGRRPPASSTTWQSQSGAHVRVDLKRQNLTVRMTMRRVTGLANAFSTKWLNLRAACALHFAYYNAGCLRLCA